MYRADWITIDHEMAKDELYVTDGDVTDGDVTDQQGEKNSPGCIYHEAGTREIYEKEKDEIIMSDNKIYRKVYGKTVNKTVNKTVYYILTHLNNGFIWTEVDEIKEDHDIIGKTDNLTYRMTQVTNHSRGSDYQGVVIVTLIIYKYEYDVNIISHQMEYKSEGTSDLYWLKLDESLSKLISGVALQGMIHMPTKFLGDVVSGFEGSWILDNLSPYDPFECPNPHPTLWGLIQDDDEIVGLSFSPHMFRNGLRDQPRERLKSHGRTIEPITLPRIDQYDKPEAGTLDNPNRISLLEMGPVNTSDTPHEGIPDSPKCREAIDDPPITQIKDEVIICASESMLQKVDKWLMTNSSQINYDIGKQLHDIIHQ